MFELKRKFLNEQERKYFMDLYNKILSKYNLNDIPTSFLMFLRFIEEWISFYEKISENSSLYDSELIEVKIIYSKIK